mmetsp:Transcript_81313/g.242317  ORF Transcript_81313/g.242317 Transcript_81313/m.242317 type:complete len:363 (+) Transcript_81313:480-1568(+)
MASVSPGLHKRRIAASAALATSSTGSRSAAAATPMPRAPPTASACATSSSAAALTSGSSCVPTSRAKSEMTSWHSPRMGQMVFSVLRPVHLTEQSVSASATVAVRMLQGSPGMASACTASAACTRRSALALPSSSTTRSAPSAASLPRWPTSFRAVAALQRTVSSASVATVFCKSSKTVGRPGQELGKAGTSVRNASTAARRTPDGCGGLPAASLPCPSSAAMAGILWVSPWRAAARMALAVSSGETLVSREELLPFARISMMISAANREPDWEGSLAICCAIWEVVSSSTATRQMGHSEQTCNAVATQSVWKVWPQFGSRKVAARSRLLMQTGQMMAPSSSALAKPIGIPIATSSAGQALL